MVYTGNIIQKELVITLSLHIAQKPQHQPKFVGAKNSMLQLLRAWRSRRKVLSFLIMGMRNNSIRIKVNGRDPAQLQLKININEKILTTQRGEQILQSPIKT